jgi:hypothetical protein
LEVKVKQKQFRGPKAGFFSFLKRRKNKENGKIIMSEKDVATGAGFHRHNRLMVKDYNEIEEVERLTMSRMPQ